MNRRHRSEVLMLVLVAAFMWGWLIVDGAPAIPAPYYIILSFVTLWSGFGLALMYYSRGRPGEDAN